MKYLIGLGLLILCGCDAVQHIRLETVNNQTVIVTGDRVATTLESEKNSENWEKFGLKPHSRYFIGNETRKLYSQP